MILKNSLKQLIRTPLKTGLFIVFLAALTAFLSFGLYMWTSVANSLDQAAGPLQPWVLLSPHHRKALYFPKQTAMLLLTPPIWIDHREWLAVQ